MKTQTALLDLLRQEMEFRNYSPRSVHTYVELMSLMQRRLETPLETITVSSFKKYLHHLITGKGVSVSTINQTISAFKLLQVDVLERDWEDFKVKRPRKEKKLPVVMSVQEVENLLSFTRNIKHRAILMLAYSSGLRKSELLDIKPSAIDSDRMQVRVVQGKGRKDRYTLLSSKALEILRVYYKTQRPDTYLFEPQGRAGSPLSSRTLDAIIKKNAAKAGLRKDVSFHTLRHSFATHLLESGVNLRLIQQFMGHSSLRTTSVYLHLTRVNPANVHSPLDEMNV
jgi:integrase/recombinase XerD